MGCKLLYGQSDAVCDWVKARLDGPEFGNCQAVGVVNDGLIAGIVFHDWNPRSETIEVSAAADSPKWATRKTLTALFAYPFDGIGVRIVYARIAESNTRARRLWRAFGAKETAIPEMRGVGEAEIIATLTREQWQKSRLFDG